MNSNLEDKIRELEEENKKLQEELKKSKRNFIPDLSELVDRLSITQLKEFFIPENKEAYAKEIKDIIHDMNVILETEELKVNAETIRAIIVVTISNREIWLNEALCRAGCKDGNNLEKSHSINGVRCLARNMITKSLGKGKIDLKVDCLAADCAYFQPSW